MDYYVYPIQNTGFTVEKYGVLASFYHKLEFFGKIEG
jgi:hypothetical protein